jgi:rubrerythrin
LAQQAGLTIDRGILVDRSFATSQPNIYAAGDVAQAYDRLWQAPRINTSWKNALEQGEQAGIAMAGGQVDYAGSYAVNFQLAAGLPFFSLGIANPAEREFTADTTLDESAQTYRKVVTRSDTLVGAMLIGDLTEAGVFEETVRGVAETAPSPVIAEQTTHETRSINMHKMTKENLKAAFAGESQAHMKYLNFAEKAAEEGKANVARLFRAASYAEQTHASAHLETLQGIGSTAENLAAAFGGESFEIEEMYPAFISVAIEQDEPAAQESMNHALQVEKIHQALYAQAKDAVDAGKDADLGDLWVCNYCGFTAEGEAPGKCPICGNPRKNFVKF